MRSNFWYKTFYHSSDTLKLKGLELERLPPSCEIWIDGHKKSEEKSESDCGIESNNWAKGVFGIKFGWMGNDAELSRGIIIKQ